MINWIMEQAQGNEIYNNLIHKEQMEVQPQKVRSRTLSKYNEIIFSPKPDSKFGNTSEVREFLDENYGPGITTMEQLIVNLTTLGRRPIVWVEMGGGGAIAMRQVTSLVGREKLTTFNVDLLDFDDKKIDYNALREIAKTTPKALRPENKPELIKANIEDVGLPKKPDIITSVSSIFYLNNPLEAICNWYNNLNDNGLLVVAAEDSWSYLIKTEGGISFSKSDTVDIFFKQLKELGVSVVFGKSNDNEFNLLMINKKPGFKLELETEIAGIRMTSDDYKMVYYKEAERMVALKTDDNGVETKKNQEYYDNISRLLQRAKGQEDNT